MAKSKFEDANEAIRFLTQMGHNVSDRKITIRRSENSQRTGLKIWSAVDYLCSYHRYWLDAAIQVK